MLQAERAPRGRCSGGHPSLGAFRAGAERPPAWMRQTALDVGRRLARRRATLMPLSIGVGVGIGACRPPSGYLDYPVSLVGGGLVSLHRLDVGQFTTIAGKVSNLAQQAGTAIPAAVQSSSSLRPTLVTRLGQQCAQFGGTQRLTIASAILSTNNNWSFAIVFEPTSTAGSQGIFSMAPLGGGTSLDIEGGNLTERNQGVGTTADGAATTTPRALIVSREAGLLKIYERTQVLTFASPSLGMGALTDPGSVIGALQADGLFGYLGYGWEWMVYQGGASGFMTSTQRTDWFTYTTNRYGL